MVNSVKEEAVGIAHKQLEADGDISMRKVGATLNISAAALYHHFANKQALLNAVADRGFAHFEKQLRAVEATEASNIIRDILDRYRKFAVEHPHLFGLMFVEPRPVTRRFPKDFAAHRLAVFNLLWKAVEDSISDNADGTPEGALYAAHDLWALTHGQIMLARAGRFENEKTFEEVLERSISRFISTL